MEAKADARAGAVTASLAVAERAPVEAERVALRAQVAALESLRESEAAAAATARSQRQHRRDVSPLSPGGRREEAASLRAMRSDAERETG